ncbi:MAG: RloB family protein [Gammaproteobacteria bacterium]|nr:RloB family protein [Gammaproteobacteria bacterium]
MGSDNLFHKRRREAKKNLQRGRAKRAAYDRVLIVCEGQKTEPNYLNELIDTLRLNSANIEVDGGSDSSPDRLWLYAKRRYEDSKKQGDVYDRIYCVFDQDEHHHYQQTLQAIGSAKPAALFSAIPSVPCFEYWLLLHWSYSTQPFYGVEGTSACDALVTELKKHMPDYQKGEKGIFSRLMSQTDQAIAWSQKAVRQGKGVGSDNPSTLMHELVLYLRALKENIPHSKRSP